MKNLANAINNKSQPVVWNPYEDNDGMNRQEFIDRIKRSGYQTIIYEDAWVMAFQSKINLHGNETLRKHLNEAVRNELYVYAAILRNEMNRSNLSVFEGAEFYY